MRSALTKSELNTVTLLLTLKNAYRLEKIAIHYKKQVRWGPEYNL